MYATTREQWVRQQTNAVLDTYDRDLRALRAFHAEGTLTTEDLIAFFAIAGDVASQDLLHVQMRTLA